MYGQPTGGQGAAPGEPAPSVGPSGAPDAAQEADLRPYLRYLEARVAALEQRVPNTMLLSPKFMNRSFAVLGHYMVSSLIVSIPIWVIYAVVAVLLFAASSGSVGGS